MTRFMLAFAPIAFAVATLGLKKFPAVAIAVGVLSAAGGGYALSVVVGNFGRRAQTRLWNTWGGAPTTRLLRTGDTTMSAVQKDVWRKAVEAVRVYVENRTYVSTCLDDEKLGRKDGRGRTTFPTWLRADLAPGRN